MNCDSQKLTNVLIAGVFIILTYLAFAKNDIRVDMATGEQDRTIAVDGEAETFVAPDTASVSLSATEKAATTNAAMNSINERMAVLIEELKRNGVEEKDIKTVQYDVQPEYSYNDGRQVFEGYRATQRVTVIIRDLNNTSDVLEVVNSAYFDNISQLTFFVDNEEIIMADLRAQAIDDAKEKAEILSHDLGVKLREIVGYNDGGSNGGYEPLYRSADMAYGVGAEAEMAEAVVPTGENQFKTSVTVVYKIN